MVISQRLEDQRYGCDGCGLWTCEILVWDTVVAG